MRHCRPRSIPSIGRDSDESDRTVAIEASSVRRPRATPFVAQRRRSPSLQSTIVGHRYRARPSCGSLADLLDATAPARPRRAGRHRASRAGGWRSRLPPRPVTGYLVARTIWVAPRLVRTVRPSRFLLASDEADHAVLGFELDGGDAPGRAGDDVGLGDREDQHAGRPGGQADVLRAVGRLDAHDQVVLERRVEPDDDPALAGRDGGQRRQREPQDLAAGRQRDRVGRRRQRRSRAVAVAVAVAVGAVAVPAARRPSSTSKQPLDQPRRRLGMLARDRAGSAGRGRRRRRCAPGPRRRTASGSARRGRSSAGCR